MTLLAQAGALLEAPAFDPDVACGLAFRLISAGSVRYGETLTEAEYARRSCHSRLGRLLEAHAAAHRQFVGEARDLLRVAEVVAEVTA